MVFFEIRPFWVDEWFFMYNLKTKSAAALMGPLDYMQQFPRIYLVVLKVITSFFNYSYISLRLPSLVVSIATILVSYNLMKQVYTKQTIARYLFILILVSSFTFTEYFVQIKQYAMEILLSSMVIWQLLKLPDITSKENISITGYALLCLSFLVFPFFSYTYPMAVAPLYFIVFFQTISLVRANSQVYEKLQKAFLIWFPLILLSFSIAFFYKLDVKQVMNDGIMHSFWDFLMIDNAHKLQSFLNAFYTLFSQTGSGLIFETLFGIIGVISFIYGLIRSARYLTKKETDKELLLVLYSCLLLTTALLLFLFRKLPIGTPRLNAFTVPSIAILIIHFLNDLSSKLKNKAIAGFLPVVLVIGVTGNIFTTYFVYFTNPVYKKQMNIYTATQKAIRDAQLKHIPMVITSGVKYPYNGTGEKRNPDHPSVWVLKTFPAYDMNQNLPVYQVKDISDAPIFIKSLPPEEKEVIAGDGEIYTTLQRH